MPPPAANLVLHNAQIYTVDDRRPTASALAVRNGRFVAVGDRDAATAACPEAPRVDAEGHTVVPGFIDAHAHLQALGHSLRRAALAGTSSPGAVVERLEEFATERDLPADAWVRGHGWDQNNWTPPRFPTRTVLDAAFPDRPVWLTRTDVHVGWANTAALNATVGLDRLRTMDDPAGGRICRDADGQPTGVLVDAAMDLVTDRIPPPSDAERDRALTAALRHTAQRGVTSLHDAGAAHSQISRFRRFIEKDAFPLRVYAMINGRGPTFDHFAEHGPLHHPSGRLNVESVKFFADGALGSRGAALLDDYADEDGNRGLLLHEAGAFQHDVQATVEAGFQVNTHAIGDRANRFVLDAYENAQRECSRPLRRPRIEHAQIVAPQDRPRFNALGVIASVQPAFAPSDQTWAPARLGSNRLDRAYAWRTLKAAGVPLAFGSDAPVEPVSPIRALHAAATHQPATDPRAPEPSLSASVSRATALHAHTRGAAYAAFQETEAGTITPGKRADFVVLSQDLMTVPKAELLDTEIIATYLDGRPIYTRADGPAT